MAVPKTTIWECEPHTRAKHAILERYLKAWFPILDRSFKKVVFLDGFAGPGIYSKGEPGSPIVALTVAQNHTATLTGELTFVFVESDQKRFEHLQAVVAERSFPKHFSISVIESEFRQVLKSELDELDHHNLDNAPIFAFVDPFGFSGVPYNLLTRLLKRKSTEVFVFFARNSVNRFLETPSVEHHMIDLFGERIVIPSGVERLQYLKGVYERKLQSIATYVGSFTMEDNTGRPIYDLFFASNNALGYVKMKEAMWSVDDSGAFHFSDQENPDQLILFNHKPEVELMRMLVEIGNKRSNIIVDKIERYVCEKTIYLTKHMKSALRQLELEGRIRVHPIKSDGKTRRPGTFPNGTTIDFI